MNIAARAWVPAVVLAAFSAYAEQASPPQGVSITLYDSGFGLVNENRRVNLAQGDNEIIVRQLPARLDSASTALSLLAGGAGVELMELRFEDDLAADGRLFTRYLGRPVSVVANGETVEGQLMSTPRRASPTADGAPLVLGMGEENARAFFSMDDVDAVNFPNAARTAYLEPALIWGARAAQVGLQNIRVSYLVDGLSWFASHHVTLLPGGAAANLSSRVGIRNEAGGRYGDARVRLVSTDRGSVAGANAQRYAYGRPEPEASRGVTLNATGTFELPQPVTIQDGQTRFYAMAEFDELPVSRFHVYDGVRFDRFQRNKQTDWSYGTEFDPAVETRVEFQISADAAAGIPGGSAKLFQLKPDGAMDYLGQDHLSAAAPGAAGSIRVGPARGLMGERARIGYSEVRPLHEYEETFEIRLSNLSDEAAQIRVVEHLYRSADFEIVKADAEYVSTAPQTIEFRADLKPAGKKTIRYTVRYRW